MASRLDLLKKTGNLPQHINNILDACYEKEEKQIWEEGLFGSPHGVKWSTSFHSSEFPGDNPKSCARKSLYLLLGVPNPEPTDRTLRTLAEAGHDIERRVVERFHRAGILLSNSPDDKHQTRVEDKEHWLSCSPDSVIKIPGKDKAHVVEIKTKYQRVIDEMKEGKKFHDENHRSQLLTQVGLLKENFYEVFPEHKDIKPPTHGTILYLSRDKPSDSYEFLFQHDQKFIDSGRAKLRKWKQFFLDDHLPERDKSWKWTEQPCRWCPLKKACKSDVKNKVSKLSESATIELAKSVRKDYDYQQSREEVLIRWGEK